MPSMVNHTKDTQETVPIGRLQTIREIWGLAREDLRQATWKGKVALGSLMLMTTYEEGPGNETLTPIIAGQFIGAEKGIAGIALTAGVAGSFITGQQLASSYIARTTAAEFPSVSRRIYKDINRVGEDKDNLRFKPFNNLPVGRRFLYSLSLGSNFNTLREVAITGRVNQDELKGVGRQSSAIAGGSVALIGAGVELTNQHFGNNQYVNFAIEWGVKDPLFWLGIMGAVLGTDYIKSRKKRTPKTKS